MSLKTWQMESVRLEIDGHMTSAGEEILCVLEKHSSTSGGVCHVRVFVLERLSAAAHFMFSLLQREVEALRLQIAADLLAVCAEDVSHQKRSCSLAQKEPRPPQIGEMPEEPYSDDRGTSPPTSGGQLLRSHCAGSDRDEKSEAYDDHGEMQPLSSASAEHMNTQTDHGTVQLLSSDCFDAEDSDDWAETKEDVRRVLVCKEAVTPEEETISSPVHEEKPHPQLKEELLQRPDEAGGSTVTLLAVKSEHDDDTDESGEAEPVAGTSTETEHMKTQAYIEYWVQSAQPTGDDQPLSSCGPEPDDEDSDESDADDSDDDWGKTRGTRSLGTLKTTKPQNTGGRRKLSPESRKDRYSCTECGKMFNYKCYLKRHAKTHTGEKDQNSSKQNNSVEKGRFCCTECGRIFNFKGNLKTHMRTHTGEKPYSCTVCGTGFAQTSSLKTHMRIHTGERPFACPVCGKGFVDKSSLKIHTRSHTGEKPFSCTICGKGCSEKSQLKTHMMTHTGEKPFLCTLCGKGCVSKGQLKTHLRTHTGEKPFSCTLCGAGFTQTGSLNVHMRTHTGEKPFSCNFCGTRFTQASSLKTHIQRGLCMRTQTEEKPLVKGLLQDDNGANDID